MNAANDNAALLRRVANGDSAAEEELIAANMGLVRNAARKFLENSSGADFDDLCQIGAMGMLRAARTFDPSYGTVFSTFAVPLIIGEIKRFLRDDGPLKIGRAIKANARTVVRAREAFAAEYGREPRISEISAATGLPPDDIVACMEASSPVRSLSESLGGEGDLILGDVIADEEDMIGRCVDMLALSNAMEHLTEEQRAIIKLRYERRFSQAQTGRILGLTQVRVSREERRIVEKLREMLVG